MRVEKKGDKSHSNWTLLSFLNILVLLIMHIMNYVQNYEPDKNDDPELSQISKNKYIVGLIQIF